MLSLSSDFFKRRLLPVLFVVDPSKKVLKSKFFRCFFPSVQRLMNFLQFFPEQLTRPPLEVNSILVSAFSPFLEEEEEEWRTLRSFGDFEEDEPSVASRFFLEVVSFFAAPVSLEVLELEVFSFFAAPVSLELEEEEPVLELEEEEPPPLVRSITQSSTSPTR